MPSFNRVVLIGRLTREPEMKYTASGLAVTTFTLAVDRRYKNQQGEKQTDFLRCKAWRQKAEFISNYVTKGRLVAVEGAIETSESTGPDGQKRYFTDIVCDNVEILESNREQGGGGYDRGAPAAGGDGGYFPDEEMGSAPPQRPAQAAPARPAASAPNRPAPRPEPAYPETDFDDSDPFADD